MNAWLQLARIALLPTILWDFSVGLMLVGGSWNPSTLYALITLLLLYHSGMMLNDLRDISEDRQANRRRPLVDGRIHPAQAAIVIGLFLLGAMALAELSGQHMRLPAGVLMIIILVYDLSPSEIRKHIGPALLAAARALSLGFAAFAVLGFDAGRAAIGLGPLAAYAMYFIFASRLAQYEESGVHGLNGLSFLGMASITPAILFYQGGVPWYFLPAWILFVVYLLRPVIPLRHTFWEPEIVARMVRHALGSAPLVPGLILLASGNPRYAPFALLAIPICMIVRQLARTWAPE